MSAGTDEPDPRERPADPAGTKPRHDPESLLPESRPPLPPRESEVVDAVAVEDRDDEADGGDLLPERRRAGSGLGGPREPRAHSPHAPRFQFLTGALIAVAVASLAAVAVAIWGTPGHKSEAAWSRWKPSTSGVAGAQEIAARVGPEYRDHGAQLVDVQTNGLAFKGTQLTVALRQAPEQGGNIQVHDDKGVLYQLCGLGPNCAIDHGKPSTKRGFLLQREGLELALYSLHYLGVKQVVVLLPPVPGKAQTVAMYFRQGDVKGQLGRPLTATLTPRAPTVSTATKSPDAGVVAQSTGTKYLFSLMGSSFNDRAFLVLDPYSPAADARMQKELAKQAKALAAASGAATSGG